MRVLIALAALAALAHAAADPTEVLGRILLKAGAGVKVIPNYTCVETLTRDYYEPVAPVERRCDVLLERKKNPTLDMNLRLTSTDRLRLEVGMTKKGEVVSWVGETRFDDRRIEEVVAHGPVAAGGFGAMLALVFGQDARKFQFERENQRRLEYSFDVPASTSHYRVKIANGWAQTAYHGGFEIDPVREEVTRMWIETAILPPAAAACVMRTQMELSPVSIGAGSFPMATTVEQQFVSPDGSEVLSKLTFSTCREYRGESSIRFGDARSAEIGGADVTETAAAIPGGLEFALELTEAIDSATAAAGDRFFARLAAPLRDGERVIAAAGSRVEGRIVRVQVVHRPTPEAVFVLRPETVEAWGARLPLASTQDTRPTPEAKTPIFLPEPRERFAGLFHVAGPNPVLPKDFHSQWRTVPR